MQEEYYTKILYPLQDGIIKIIKKTDTPFYLTGGTALSRYCFHHRYSDDLDFFVNSDKDYNKHIRKIIGELERYQSISSFVIDKNAIIAEKDYTQIIIVKQIAENRYPLKIDLINDIAVRFGKVIIDANLGRVDNVLNILSNKLTALYRYEPKDVADIWIISKNTAFTWNKIFKDAKEKELGLDVIKLSEIIKTFPVDYIDSIKWSISIQKSLIMEELSIIAEDLFWGKDNSLFLT